MASKGRFSQNSYIFVRQGFYHICFLRLFNHFLISCLIQKRSTSYLLLILSFLYLFFLIISLLFSFWRGLFHFCLSFPDYNLFFKHHFLLIVYFGVIYP